MYGTYVGVYEEMESDLDFNLGFPNASQMLSCHWAAGALAWWI